MGLLLDTRSGRLITLSARTLIGRSPVCLVQIDDPRASAEHAVIAWSGECWEIRDLGSLNGTWLDGRRLAAGERAPLHCDGRLAFGGADAWIVADDRPAGPGARNEATSEVIHSTSGILALPSSDDPQATIFRHADGQWLVELGTELRTIADREPIDLGGHRWWLFLPNELGPLPRTLQAEGAPLVLEEVRLRFAPSLDEEHVDVRVSTDDGKEWGLPSRSSHYMLLTLARARLKDARTSVAPEEQGWIYASDLADMLQYSPERLNLEIFRARSLFAKLGFADSAHLIERRTASRQLRIGVARLDVTRG
ncbi:MAG TPA: FHA domain-containing protein [Kofleriaceae bacterium]